MSAPFTAAVVAVSPGDIHRHVTDRDSAKAHLKVGAAVRDAKRSPVPSGQWQQRNDGRSLVTGVLSLQC